MPNTHRHATQPGGSGHGAGSVIAHLPLSQVAQILPDLGFLQWASVCPGSLDRLWALNPQHQPPVAQDAFAATKPMDLSSL